MMHKFLAPSIIHPGFLQTFYMKKFNTLQDMHFYTKKTHLSDSLHNKVSIKKLEKGLLSENCSYLEKTPLSDLMRSRVCISLTRATADFLMYCFPMTCTTTDPLFKYSTSCNKYALDDNALRFP